MNNELDINAFISFNIRFNIALVILSSAIIIIIVSSIISNDIVIVFVISPQSLQPSIIQNQLFKFNSTNKDSEYILGKIHYFSPVQHIDWAMIVWTENVSWI